MNIECTQENLAKALAIVGRLAGTRGTLPVLGNILLSVEKGRLKLSATDLEIGVYTWIGGKVEKEGAITVPARLLVDFINTNTDSTIVLESKDTVLNLKSERFNANIKGIDASEFPLIPEIKRVNEITLSAKDFKEAINQTVFATAIDETRPVLTGVLAKFGGNNLKLVATDSYRLAEKSLNLTEKSADLSIIIPARTLQELNRIVLDDTKIILSVAENQILFSFGDTVLISRLIDGIFPDYEQIIPKNSTTEAIVDKGTFSQAIKMASFFARESANNIKIKVDGENQMEIVAISPQLGDSISKIPIKFKGETVEVAFNAKFILDALNILNTQELELKLAGKLQPGIIIPKDIKNYLYLIMPLRVEV